MFELSKKIVKYNICPDIKVNISKIGVQKFKVQQSHQFEIEVVDSVADYLQLMKQIFDFGVIKGLISGGFKVTANALHGGWHHNCHDDDGDGDHVIIIISVMGPYILKVLCEELGVPKGDVSNCIPLPDFGKGHPDPNLTYARELVVELEKGVYDFGAAFDGDGVSKCQKNCDH